MSAEFKPKKCPKCFNTIFPDMKKDGPIFYHCGFCGRYFHAEDDREAPEEFIKNEQGSRKNLQQWAREINEERDSKNIFLR